MKAYVLVVETIRDQELFARYRGLVAPILEKYGGRFLVRGGNATVLEGPWFGERTVVIEFPSRQHAETWYHSPEYQEVLPMRLNSGDNALIIIDGV